jgi:mono/diheme cytochrome c family protein
MPDFRLNEVEAGALVSYLMKNAKGEAATDMQGNARRGKALFASAGCANCHKIKDLPAAVAAKSMTDLVATSDWTKGCLGADDASRGKAPDFGLADGQREALRAFAASAGGMESLKRDAGPEVAERAVRQLRCAACHARDEVEDRWSTLSEEVADLMPEETNIESDQGEAEEGKGPRSWVPRGLGKLHAGDRLVIAGDQTRPALTWAGAKLRAEWMGRFIAGDVGYKPRYWMRARMPAFGAARAKGIAEGLALEHGFPTVPPKPGEAKGELAEVGRKLVGTGGGFACVTCHSVADVRATSPFEAPAPNLMHVPERLNHDYYVRWMRKPMRFAPGTKMPQLSEEGRSALADILGGEADRQFEAIWQYTLQGERMGAPE